MRGRVADRAGDLRLLAVSSRVEGRVGPSGGLKVSVRAVDLGGQGGRQVAGTRYCPGHAAAAQAGSSVSRMNARPAWVPGVPRGPASSLDRIR